MKAPIDETYDPWPEGRNLQRYDQPHTVLSDYHSPVAIGCSNTDQMGVTQLFLQSHEPTASRPVFDPLLKLFCKLQDEWVPVPVIERTCWPGGWIERGYVDTLRIVQQTWFSSPNEITLKIAISMDARDRGAAVELALAGGHANAPVLMTGAIDDDALNMTLTTPQCDKEGQPYLRMPIVLTTEPAPRKAGFRAERSQNNMPPAVTETLAPRTDDSAVALGYWLELTPIEPTPANRCEATVRLSWQFNDTPMPPAERQSFEATITRWKTLLGRPAPLTGGSYWQRKAWVALADLYTSTVKAPGYGNMQHKLSIGACTLEHLSHSYFWDTMMTVPALATMDETWSAEVIENFTQYLEWQDCAPFAISAFPPMAGVKRSWGGGQAPIAAWAVTKLLHCTGKTALASRLYPALKAIVDRWFEYGDFNRDGIPEWVNTGAPCDDSPRFDAYGGRPGWHNIYLPPIACVCLCAYLLMEMRCLGQMAAGLGMHDDEADWKRQYEALAEKTRRLLWDNQEKIFYDLDLTVYEPTKVKTFFNLLPLWAGLEMPEADIHAAIQQHLLNPDELWGPIPFPSVAYNEPSYNPLGYWRGRTWPHVYFWNTEILAKYGYIDEANEAKKRFLRVMADGIDIPENIVSSLVVNDRHKHGLPHYSWGMGVTLMFLWDWHLKPL